jgi:hypothetical protein
VTVRPTTVLSEGATFARAADTTGEETSTMSTTAELVIPTSGYDGGRDVVFGGGGECPTSVDSSGGVISPRGFAGHQESASRTRPPSTGS